MRLAGEHWLRATTALAVVLIVTLAGCGTASSRQQDVALYFWNETGSDMGYVVDPQTDPPILGDIRTGMTTVGCIRLPNPWTLNITQGPAVPNRPDNVVRGRVAVPDATARSTITWIHIARDGTIESGIGVPGWWQADIQVCAAG